MTPASLAAAAASPESVTLQWEAAAAGDAGSGVARFVVTYKAGGKPPPGCTTAGDSSARSARGVTAAAVTLGADAGAVTVAGLLPGKNYYFRLCAIDNVSNAFIG